MPRVHCHATTRARHARSPGSRRAADKPALAARATDDAVGPARSDGAAVCQVGTGHPRRRSTWANRPRPSSRPVLDRLGQRRRGPPWHHDRGGCLHRTEGRELARLRRRLLRPRPVLRTADRRRAPAAKTSADRGGQGMPRAAPTTPADTGMKIPVTGLASTDPCDGPNKSMTREHDPTRLLVCRPRGTKPPAAALAVRQPEGEVRWLAP